MIERWSSSDRADDADRGLVELLREAQPYQADPFRKRRVLVRVLNQAKQAGPRRARLRAALVLGGVLVAATAGAVVGNHLLSSSEENEGLTLRAVERPVSVGPSQRPVEVVREPEPVAPAPPPAVSEARPSERPRAAPRAAEAQRDSEDAAPVLEAIRALRKERDPARAEKLLREYMKNNPKGVLSEDALALSIEAAAARRDPRAAEYARRYLSRYPQGKYRTVAQRALASSR